MKMKKCDLFFYSPKESLSTQVFDKCETMYFEDPRDQPLFMEGIDNLTPVIFFEIFFQKNYF